LTDNELIKAARSGDAGAFKELVQRYESLVAATVTGMLGRCPEVDDVGQETFIRFYRSMDTFRGEASVGTYLTRIAINLSLNALKKRKRRRLMFLDKSPEELGDIPDVGASTSTDDDKEVVHRAIQKLEPRFRSVIVLRLMNGYSTRETAEILKIPEGTVLSRLARAQMKLKVLLSPTFGGSDG
jgi:RNA polymerase sigma-70 factor (ECF subfamily)